MSDIDDLFTKVMEARANCQGIANMRQGLRMDGSLPTSGVRRMITPKKQNRLKWAAVEAARQLLFADRAYNEAMKKRDDVG